MFDIGVNFGALLLLIGPEAETKSLVLREGKQKTLANELRISVEKRPQTEICSIDVGCPGPWHLPFATPLILAGQHIAEVKSNGVYY